MSRILSSVQILFMKKNMKQRGFTLIELMITVGIIGILAAIALPSYTQYVQRGWRADARVSILENAQFMARVYSQNLDYSKALGGTTPTLPIALSPQGSVAATAKYDITATATLATATAVSSFEITAKARGWTDSKCGDLTITQNGLKGTSTAALGANPTQAQIDAAALLINDCWLR